MNFGPRCEKPMKTDVTRQFSTRFPFKNLNADVKTNRNNIFLDQVNGVAFKDQLHGRRMAHFRFDPPKIASHEKKKT